MEGLSKESYPWRRGEIRSVIADSVLFECLVYDERSCLYCSERNVSGYKNLSRGSEETQLKLVHYLVVASHPLSFSPEYCSFRNPKP